MSDITRGGVEKALLEFTGFKGDQAVIDGLMVVIEAWAVQMAEGLAASPAAVREGHVHLLVQQAELLLDSAGRLQLASALAENVTFLTGLTDGMQLRSMELADKVASIAGKQERLDGLAAVWTDPGQAAADEITRMTQGWDDAPVLTDAVKAEVESALGPHKITRKPSPAPFELNGITYIHCQGECDLDLPATEFFRNSKAAHGYESKCRHCRKIKAA